MDYQIVLNSNPWFSAVTDYSLQLAKYVSQKQTSKVIYCAPAGSIALRKASQSDLSTNAVPLFPFSVARFLVTWHAVGELVKSHKPSVVWVFEGREHTLCALHRLFNKKLWQSTRLVRVRGQANPVRATALNKWVYRSGVSGVAFVADVVEQRTPFAVPDKMKLVHLYCTAQLKQPVIELSAPAQMMIVSRKFSLDFTQPTLTVVGRYDPVKGHQQTIEALAAADFKNWLRQNQWMQVVFIGESQNVSAISLYELACRTFAVKGIELSESRRLVEVPEKRIRLLIIDERVRDVAVWMRQSSFGLIPSLGSEVICRVAVEFLQQGTPLVSSNAGALSEVLPASCALLYENGPAANLAGALEKALILCNQPDVLPVMRQNALAHGKRFGPEGWNGLISWARALPPFEQD
ncbi:MAG: glycosyltransferase [Proteobacteria bacterium]|nr:glycosyltransferase [Pseudomonadota bacterium]